VISSNWQASAGFWQLGVFGVFVLLRSGAAASDFHFDRDALAFANQTVFEYHEGHAYSRKKSK
jgi:hypothetical protein